MIDLADEVGIVTDRHPTCPWVRHPAEPREVECDHRPELVELEGEPLEVVGGDADPRISTNARRPGSPTVLTRA